MTATRALPSYAIYARGRQAVVTSIVPNFGPEDGGTPIELRGYNLDRAERVYIAAPSAVEATDFEVVSPELVTCTTPPGVGLGTVYVFAPTAIVVGQFFYEPAGVGPPRLDSITPDHGPRTGGTPVTIRGYRIGGASAVNFGFATATAVATVDDDTVTCVTPQAIGVITIPHTVFVHFDDERPTLQNLLFTYEPV